MFGKKDFLFITFCILFFLPFFLFPNILSAYKNFNHDHGLVTAFIKFAILATTGEIIGLRIKTGSYCQKGFGILPRALVWGFIGITIKIAFIIFTTGTPASLAYMGFNPADTSPNDPLSFNKVLVAFSTSMAMNVIYAPVMMTFHKITDTHIIATGGTLKGLFQPIKLKEIFINLNWEVQWNFVFKKTIPFFWIPAHTITFLLPADYQVLFAALLGVALGTILAIANKMEIKN